MLILDRKMHTCTGPLPDKETRDGSSSCHSSTPSLLTICIRAKTWAVDCKEDNAYTTFKSSGLKTSATRAAVWLFRAHSSEEFAISDINSTAIFAKFLRSTGFNSSQRNLTKCCRRYTCLCYLMWSNSKQTRPIKIYKYSIFIKNILSLWRNANIRWLTNC